LPGKRNEDDGTVRFDEFAAVYYSQPFETKKEAMINQVDGILASWNFQ